MQVNPLTREVLVKIVYYGPGLGGKTTSLQRVHKSAPPETRGQIVSLATPVDRTLYFDFLPIRLASVRGHHVRLQLFTVPGQVYFNATRKLVLTGADGVVFVADSQRVRHDANLESIENLVANLEEQGRKLAEVPHVYQFNKCDLEGLIPFEELQGALNPEGARSFSTCATTGEGVLDSLDALVRLVLDDLEARHVFGEPRESNSPLTLGRADEALEEQIGRASEQIWKSTLANVPAVAPEAAVANPPASVPDSGVAPVAASAPASPPASLAAASIGAQPVPPQPVPGDSAPGAAVAAAAGGMPSPLPAAVGSVRAPSQSGVPGAMRGPSFVALFGEHGQRIRELETALGAGRLREAIDACDQLSLQVLGDTSAVASLAAGVAPAMVALLLGVDGGRWLAFRRTVRRVREGGPVAELDALEAFALLIDLRLRSLRMLSS